MANIRSALLLTRPKSASEKFLAQVVERTGYTVDAVVSPVIEIRDLGSLPKIDEFETIILSSRHAVERLGRNDLLRGVRVATVGVAVAERAREFGAEAIVLGYDANGLLARSGELLPPCLHCRGAHSRGDIAKTLSERGIETSEAVVYDQIAQDLTQEALDLFASFDRVVAPVFSPRSSELLWGQIPFAANLRVVAISPAAAECWGQTGRVSIAETPDSEGMVREVIKAI